ncbi:hypothetical protein F2Q69_00037123 [Brassica cretica]|uniref:Zinc finger PMZ-type domain-containing protein n=1 Tax=Brassica cretica TaxID=69181 RepID=A0A8S9SMU7_BRACR|nr:hypothetical protein F2Q69_00037123 [Brassica cretica]
MGTLTVQHIDSNRSYVTGGDFNCMVDLEKRSCACKQYDLDKIPYEHAIKWLNVGKLLKLPCQVCLPPTIGKQRGRLKMKRYLSAIEKAKRIKRKLLKKKNQTITTSNPPPATKEGNQSSRITSTKKRGRNQAPSTPIRQKQTNLPRRMPSTNPSSKKKPKYSAKIIVPITPSPG